MDPEELVRRMGPHAATRLGLDLDDPASRDTWLLAAVLLSARAPEAAALERLGRLLAEGLLAPANLAARGGELAQGLSGGPWKEPEALTARALRVAEALVTRGGVDAVEASADGLDSLGEGLVGLASGLGPATVLRFLRPLRGVWSNAADAPPLPAALAAAVCLGWTDDGAADLALPEGGETAPRDIEAALERLGGTSCRSRRRPRCPLADLCMGPEA